MPKTTKHKTLRAKSPVPATDTVAVASKSARLAPAAAFAASRRFLILGLIIVITAFLVWQNKGLIVAATVNGRPVWRLSLEKRMNDHYATQTLDELVNEQLILDAAAKKGVSANDKEIADKITTIEKSLAGKISLNDALAQQGLTMDDFRQQVRLQILIEKLLADKLTVTDQEVSDYVDKNKSSLIATDSAGQIEEARNTLLSQKRSEAFQNYFTNLKKSAKVTKYF